MPDYTPETLRIQAKALEGWSYPCGQEDYYPFFEDGGIPDDLRRHADAWEAQARDDGLTMKGLAYDRDRLAEDLVASQRRVEELGAVVMEYPEWDVDDYCLLCHAWYAEGHHKDCKRAALASQPGAKEE